MAPPLRSHNPLTNLIHYSIGNTALLRFGRVRHVENSPSTPVRFNAVEEAILMVDESRVAALQEILKNNPDDAFARYALGLEFSGAGDSAAALAEFEHLLAAHPDYTNGY